RLGLLVFFLRRVALDEAQECPGVLLESIVQAFDAHVHGGGGREAYAEQQAGQEDDSSHTDGSVPPRGHGTRTVPDSGSMVHGVAAARRARGAGESRMLAG